MIRIALAGATAALWCALSPLRAQEDSWIGVGKPFPLISLPLAGNEEKRDSIERYRGRKLMVHCFASW